MRRLVCTLYWEILFDNFCIGRYYLLIVLAWPVIIDNLRDNSVHFQAWRSHPMEASLFQNKKEIIFFWQTKKERNNGSAILGSRV
jgi:hypothetical protein